MSTPRRGRGRGRGGGGAGAGAGALGRSSSDTPAVDRALRQKSDRRQYVDGGDSDEEEETLKQTFSVQEKLRSSKFPQFFVKELKGEEVTVEYFQRTGFNVPLFVREKVGLGMTAPDSFTVTDVKNAVGARRTVEVMDCTTQRNSEMSMKEWEEYYNSASEAGREGKKLNVISLEFSFTRLEPYVIAPKVVRQVDWVDNVWPRHLKEQQTDVSILCVHPAIFFYIYLVLLTDEHQMLGLHRRELDMAGQLTDWYFYAERRRSQSNPLVKSLC